MPDSVEQPALLVLAGPTASGKSSLALRIAETFGGEIISCDSVAIYRGLDVGSAKPSFLDRARVAHHGLDLLDPDQPSNAGDYAREARKAIACIAARGRLPVLAGGTGLYMRAALDGLAPAPTRDEALRERLRTHARRRGQGSLHRLLRRFDPAASASIHAHDEPKLIRSLEVFLLGRQPQTLQWQAGRDPLEGFRTLRLALEPPRAALYDRINARAAAMFSQGILEETEAAVARFGPSACGLGSLGYVQALAVLQGRQALAEAIAEVQQGHRRYAKRQLTWFRREKDIEWVHGFGDDASLQSTVLTRVDRHLKEGAKGKGS